MAKDSDVQHIVVLNAAVLLTKLRAAAAAASLHFPADPDFGQGLCPRRCSVTVVRMRVCCCPTVVLIFGEAAVAPRKAGMLRRPQPPSSKGKTACALARNSFATAATKSLGGTFA